MFYSHEILTSRKYGVATIWLVATLGAKSTARKVTRKAICEVDVQKACGTIIEPDAPMALRLQSSLLYGVTRVYAQQCGYVLSDAQAAQNGIRALFKVPQKDELDPEAGKARPEQLVLLDDPAFLPEIALPPLDFAFLDMDPQHDSQGSTQSMMSVRQRSGSDSTHSIPALHLPSSLEGSRNYRLPMDDPFGGSSVPKLLFGPKGGMFNDEVAMLPDDLNFEFDEDGNIHDIPVSVLEARRASRRVRVADVDVPNYDYDNFDVVQYGEGDMVLPDAEPFQRQPKIPMMSGGLQGSDIPLHADTEDLVYSRQNPASEEPSSVSAEAPQRRKKGKAKKNLIPDQTQSLSNNALIAWRDNYSENMAAATLVKNNRKADSQAKKNALHFVYGCGINGIGEGVGSLDIPSPLAMFMGGSLMAMIARKSLHSPVRHSKRARKDVEEVEEHSEHSSKRPCPDEEMGRGQKEDFQLNFDEYIDQDQRNSSTIEIGRDAPSALVDYPSSAMMPWNVSASLHSHQRGISSRPGSQIAGSATGRKVASSPLVGRGSALPGNLEQFSLLHEEDDIQYGRSGDFESIHAGPLPSSFQKPSDNPEFELFGPAAEVDTQTAGQYQWVRQALDKESHNFFEYVKNTINEKGNDELGFQDAKQEKYVIFEELFEVKNTAVVAAQAFYHMLTLATKNRIWVEQSEGVVENGYVTLDSEIRIGVMSKVI